MGRLFDSPVHLLILLLVIVVLFGAKRLPDAARGVGRSLRILKAEVKDMKDEDARPGTAAVEGKVLPSTPPAPAPQPGTAQASDQRHDA